MTFLTNAFKVIGGLAALLIVALVTIRNFSPELEYVGCAIGVVEDCAEDPTTDGVDLAGLLNRIQDGIKTVQNLNALEKEPHMFFVDGLKVEIFFAVTRNSENKISLVVVPAEGVASTQTQNTQKLVLDFSTTTDEHIQKYISDGCNEDSPLRVDVRLESFCQKAREIETATGPKPEGDSAELDIETLGLDLETLYRSHDFTAFDAKTPTAGVGLENTEACQQYGLCANSKVDSLQYDPATGAVKGVDLSVSPEEQQNLYDAIQRGDVALDGLTIAPNGLGGVRIAPDG